MTTAEVKQKLGKSKNELTKEFGILRLGIFGSVAEGKANRSSDIDLFYVLGENKFLPISQLEAFENKIKKILQRKKVDLVNLRYMNPIVRYRAEKHFIYV